MNWKFNDEFEINNQVRKSIKGSIEKKLKMKVNLTQKWIIQEPMTDMRGMKKIIGHIVI